MRDDLANPNNGLNLVPNPLQYQNVISQFEKPKRLNLIKNT